MGVLLVSAISLVLTGPSPAEVSSGGHGAPLALPSAEIVLRLEAGDAAAVFRAGEREGLPDAALAEPLIALVPRGGELDAYSFGAVDVFELDRLGVDGQEGVSLDAYGPLETSSSVSFRYQRPTSLNTGGLGVSDGELRDVDGQPWAPAVVEAGAGEFELHDLAMQWNAFESGHFSWIVTSGVRAIRAQLDATDAGGADPRGVVAVPLIGTGVRWSMPNDFHISGIAETQTVSSDASVVDLRAEAGIDFTPNVGFAAGYQYLRSTFEVESIGAEIRQEGPFARFQIRF